MIDDYDTRGFSAAGCMSLWVLHKVEILAQMLGNAPPEIVVS
jgi:hypothetical protein